MQQITFSTLSAIVSNMVEGVIFLDSDDVIRVCNPAAERIRQVKADRILGRPIYDIHHPRTNERIRELLASLKGGMISASNRVIQVQNRYFDNTYSAVLDEAGGYLGTLLVSRDISEQRRLSAENQKLRKILETAPETPRLISQSEPMRKVLEMVEAVAPLDSTVLLTGENGTGKELIMERIHQLSYRHEAPLILVNCAALPDNLIESELFGHVRGAFTGAIEDRKGKFELAHGGTLFLDEIGELPVAAQAKLLRALQERVVYPVGGRREVRVDVRIIAATNRDLAADVASGRFREDLFYRLNVISIELPSLRHRRDDILLLAEHFVVQACHEMRKSPRRLAPQVRELLLAHPLPGNVRQLKNALERAVALGKGELILPDDLPPEFRLRKETTNEQIFSPELTLRDALTAFEQRYISQALCYYGRKKAETAQSLGISRKNLWEKLQRFGSEKANDTDR